MWMVVKLREQNACLIASRIVNLGGKINNKQQIFASISIQHQCQRLQKQISSTFNGHRTPLCCEVTNNNNSKNNNYNNYKNQTVYATRNPFAENLVKTSTIIRQRRRAMSATSVINYFGHTFIDRRSEKRKDAKWIDEHMRSDNAVFVLFHVDKPYVLIDSENNGNNADTRYSLGKFSYSEVQSFVHKCAHVIFLGIEYEKSIVQRIDDCDGSSTANTCQSPYSSLEMYDKSKELRAWFCIETSMLDQETDLLLKSKQGGKFFEGNFLRLMAIQDIKESSIIAQARSICCWIDRNKFCASCGQPNELLEAGNKLSCKNSACKSHDKLLNKQTPSNIHYPRIDPVVIMLIVNQARTHMLLGRKRSFPTNMFSCLAGYVEAGESLEEAVRREVFEESGLYTDRVVYHSSQPWPFPSTLMLGCLAYASSETLNVDRVEIEEARWFSMDEIQLILNKKHPDNIYIPTDRTIAHQLIAFWSENKSLL